MAAAQVRILPLVGEGGSVLEDVLGEAGWGWVVEGGGGEEVGFDIRSGFFHDEGHGRSAAADVPGFKAFDEGCDVNVTPGVGSAGRMGTENISRTDHAEASESLDGGAGAIFYLSIDIIHWMVCSVLFMISSANSCDTDEPAALISSG